MKRRDVCVCVHLLTEFARNALKLFSFYLYRVYHSSATFIDHYTTTPIGSKKKYHHRFFFFLPLSLRGACDILQMLRGIMFHTLFFFTFKQIDIKFCSKGCTINGIEITFHSSAMVYRSRISTGSL